MTRTRRRRPAAVARHFAVAAGAVFLSVMLGGCIGRSATAGARTAEANAPRLQSQVVGSSPSSDRLFVAQQDRLLVRRAALVIEVERPGDVPPRATALTTSVGGYVQSVSITDGGAYLVLRVPAGSIEAVLDSLGRLGRVDSRTVSAEDVTEQSVDLEARVASLRAARDRLRELQGRAAAVAELVAAEAELARIQGELDSIEGRLKLLRGSVALAEVTLHARQRTVLGPLGVLFAGIGKLLGKLFVIR
jgi:hypothetical protein